MLICFSWGGDAAPGIRPWVPAAWIEQENARNFLNYVIECAPVTNNAKRSLHLSFIGTLLQRWSGPKSPIRPSFRAIISFVNRPDTTSRVSLSEDGAKIAVAIGVMVYLVAAGCPPIAEGSVSTQPQNNVYVITNVLTAVIFRKTFLATFPSFTRLSHLYGCLKSSVQCWCIPVLPNCWE
jgi:hypothetical protein